MDRLTNPPPGPYDARVGGEQQMVLLQRYASELANEEQTEDIRRAVALQIKTNLTSKVVRAPPALGAGRSHHG